MNDRLDEAKRKVDSFITERQKEIIKFAGEYIRHPSSNPLLVGYSLDEELTCQNWLREQFDRFGFFDTVDYWEVEKGRPNIAAVWKGIGGGQTLLLNGHSDVVPVTEEHKKDWTGPGGPWSGEVHDGKLWGRGAADMKAGNTAFIMACKLIHDAGIRLKGDLILSAVIGEESGQHALGCDTVLDRGYKAPFAIIPELTGLRIHPVLKGELYFGVKVKGKATHICNRNRCGTQPLPYGEEVAGISAIDKMWKIQGAIFELERQWSVFRQHPMIPPGGQFININTIQGGQSFTSVPDTCEVSGSCLFNPGQTSASIMKEIEQAVESVVMTDDWLKQHPPELEIPYKGLLKEPVDVPVDHPGCQALVESYRETMGAEPEVSVSPFVCDGNFWFPRGQMVVVFGPGDLHMGVHGTNEYVPVAQVIDATRVLAAMMIQWCGIA